jgi:hypothetical protein
MDQGGKGAIKWTRPSCRAFAANAVRLQLHALAYLGNFMRTVALPRMAKVAVPRQMFAEFSRSLPDCGRRPRQHEGAASDSDKRLREGCALSQGKATGLSPSRQSTTVSTAPCPT